MMIKVQHQDHQWQVVQPDAAPVPFESGASAFDFANDLARAHHAETGDSSGVRVEVGEAFVDAIHYD
ncbi:hypothetical protein [Stenotrophomonas bentonitica]|uniref:hypothetical protein n=1 Tax=Stenotrophomonas bentonitica TaxID=1450134 RepID=UPI00345ED34D